MNPNQTSQELTVEVAETLVKQVDSRKQDMIDLNEKFNEACQALDKGTDSIKEAWVKWLGESRTYLQEMITWRMAMSKECREGMKASQDMIDFLADDKTKAKLQTLREFVDVAERFKVLRESGFLDAMTDTMLKMKQ